MPQAIGAVFQQVFLLFTAIGTAAGLTGAAATVGGIALVSAPSPSRCSALEYLERAHG